MTNASRTNVACIPVIVVLIAMTGCTPRADGPLNSVESDSGNKSEVCQPTSGATTAYLALPIAVDDGKVAQIGSVSLVSPENIELGETRLIPVSLDSQYILELGPLRPEVADAWDAGGAAVGADLASGEAVELMAEVTIADAAVSATTGGFEIDYTSGGAGYRYRSTVTYLLTPGTC